MTHSCIEDTQTLVGNEFYRDLAHSELDKLFDSVDDVRDAFGSVRLEVPYQNGYFQRVETVSKNVHQ